VISAELPSGRAPRIVAVYSFRYDAHLVPAMLENVAPLVDGWIGYDDSAASGEFSDEPARRYALLSAARDAGAEWALAIDPDERYERRLRSLLPRLIEGEARAYSFWFREMYTPTRYRVDGLWGRKSQVRLVCLRDGVVAPAKSGLHTSWHDLVPETRPVRSEANLYHLKMIDPTRRRARAELYERLDPEHRMQAIGYHYLADDAGLRLERIPLGRGYHPRHREDGGLWMSPGGDSAG